MPSESHTCPTCFKEFSRRGDLTRHANIHAGYKPHKCHECGKSFSQYSGLKTHRNVHSRVKPFSCEIDGCKAAFGDPSSRARHCKETHRTVGTYRCPVARCKSSIKRRSAFTQHLKKHGIDPDSINVAALAPVLIPRKAPYQMKPSKKNAEVQPTQDPAAHAVMPLLNIVYHAGGFYHHHNGPNGSSLQPVEQLSDGQGAPYVMHGGWPQGAIELPDLPEAGLYTIDMPVPMMPAQPLALPTEGLLSFDSPSPLYAGAGYIDSPMSNPGLSYSSSPSPSPPRQSLLHAGLDMQAYASSSSPRTPAPSPIQNASLPFFHEPASYSKTTTEWDFDASIFQASHEQFNGIHV